MLNCVRILALMLPLLTLAAAARVQAQLPDSIDISSQYLPGVELDLPRAKTQVSVYDFRTRGPCASSSRGASRASDRHYLPIGESADAPGSAIDGRSFADGNTSNTRKRGSSGDW